VKIIREKYKKVVWEKNNISSYEKNLLFGGDNHLNETLMNLNTPKQILDYFSDENKINNFISETNLFSAQKDITFFGICILTSIHSLPSLRRYWSPVVGISLVQSTMTWSRYEIIRKVLHYNNNDDMVPKGNENHDRLFKTRPILNSLNQNFQKIPIEQCLAIDEQMYSTKARYYLKQYLPDKHSKWGYKFFCIGRLRCIYSPI
jgi:hypothetical protein